MKTTNIDIQHYYYWIRKSWAYCHTGDKWYVYKHFLKKWIEQTDSIEADPYIIWELVPTDRLSLLLNGVPEFSHIT